MLGQPHGPAALELAHRCRRLPTLLPPPASSLPPPLSPEAVANMAAAQRRRRERERQARAGGGGGALSRPPDGDKVALARERAVIELSRLRAEVFQWMQVGGCGWWLSCLLSPGVEYLPCASAANTQLPASHPHMVSCMCCKPPLPWLRGRSLRRSTAASPACPKRQRSTLKCEPPPLLRPETLHAPCPPPFVLCFLGCGFAAVPLTPGPPATLLQTSQRRRYEKFVRFVSLRQALRDAAGSPGDS